MNEKQDLFKKTNKKLIYIANIRLPTEKAHGLQIMKMNEAFAAEGNEVILLVPTRRNSITQDPHGFYGVRKNFSIVYIDCPDFIRFGSIGFVLSSWIFGFRAVKEALRLGFNVVYSRDGRALWLLSWKSSNFFWEVHDDQRKWWAKRLLKQCAGLVTTNKALVLLHTAFVEQDIYTLAAPNAASPDEFKINRGKSELRQDLGLNNERKIVLYAGHLYAYKGVDAVAEAARRLPEYDFVFIGGMKHDIEQFGGRYKNIPNIKLLGHKEHHEVAAYLRAADVLLLPNSAKDQFSLLYTSPIKLFEYMASGTPIIASDIPSIREILDESAGYFVKPDDAENLAAVIDHALKNQIEAEEKALAALELSKKYSYTERARKILHFMNHD